VNLAQIGVVLPAGTHYVTLRYTTRGLAAGLALAGLGGILLAVAARRAVWSRPGPRVTLPVPPTMEMER
jgi:hypothetical protein